MARRSRRRKHGQERARLRWSKKDIDALIWGWEYLPTWKLAHQLQRSEEAVYKKANVVGLVSRHSNDVRLNEIVERSGFWKGAVLRVVKRLGIKLTLRKRVTPGRGKHRGKGWPRYTFTQEDADIIVAELKKLSGRDRISGSFEGEWGTGGKPTACLGCGSTARPHESIGYCVNCYAKVRRIRSGLSAPFGWVSFADVIHRTEFGRDKVTALAKRMGVEFKRVGKGYRLFVTKEDAERVVAAAAEEPARSMSSKKGVWGCGGKPERCVVCGKNNRPYKAGGMCHRCYTRWWREKRKAQTC